ncbi:hypothetical protein KKF61_03005 [Patescibacteria group bacterium]|nr:hypothetical protein [Patescibacteria group bacterium]
MEKVYDYPVWATQGGGLVREVGGMLIFVESPPNFPELNVGDEMPAEWGIAAANNHARDQVEFEEDTGLLIDLLFAQAASGRISNDQVGDFFPEDVRERNA